MASRTFGSKKPYKPHLNRGSGGVQAEVSKLRSEVDQAFLSLETDGQLAKYNTATSDPTVNNDASEGYSVLSRWANITGNREYVCLDAAEGAAVWVETTAAGGTANLPLVFWTGQIPAGATQSLDIPGPAPGFIRVFDGICISPDEPGGTTGTVQCLLRNTVTLVEYAAPGFATATSNTVVPFHSPIGENEVIRLTTGASGVLTRVTTTYRDYPASNITLIRQPLSAVAATIIPEPPPGFFRRFYRRPPPHLVDFETNGSVQVAGLISVNRDSVSIALRWRLNGVLIQRGITQTAGSGVRPQFPIPFMPVLAGGGNLTVEMSAAVTTPPGPFILGAYETLAI